MSIDVMKQALEALDSDNPDVQLRAATALRAAIEQAHDWDEVEALRESLREHMAEIHRLRAVIQKSVEPIAWVYPEALEAFKSGKPWTAYGENGDGPYPDGVKRIPLYLSDAVAPRVEPPVAESGAGFESLPASPQWQGLTNQEAVNAAVYAFCQIAASPEEQQQIASDLVKACNEPRSELMLFAATIEELLEEKNR